MKKLFVLALIAGIAYAPATFAQDATTPKAAKADRKEAKMEKKTDKGKEKKAAKKDLKMEKKDEKAK